MKQLWLLVGGNGAGKSTFYRTQLKPLGMPFVNADDIARDVFSQSPEVHSYEAAKIAENLRNSLLEQGKNFCFETVFSHPSKIDFVAKAFITLYRYTRHTLQGFRQILLGKIGDIGCDD